jgi:hypothetical protein
VRPASVAPDGLSDLAASVSRQAVPQQHNRLAPMARKRVEETDQMGAAHSATLTAQQPAKSLGRSCCQNQTDCRLRGPTERLPDNRSLASGRPGGANRGSLGESRPPDRPSGVGPFLTVGHSLRTQRSMSCSSLSLARLVGLWRLHPRLRSLKSSAPLVPESSEPTQRANTADSKASSHFGLAMALGEKLGGGQPASLQDRKVPPGPCSLTHARNISHWAYLLLNYAKISSQ